MKDLLRLVYILILSVWACKNYKPQIPLLGFSADKHTPK